MERRVFGIRKVSIQQGQEPEKLLNNELWGYQVRSNQVNNVTKKRIKIDANVGCMTSRFLIKCRLAYLEKGIASTHKKDQKVLNGQLSTIWHIARLLGTRYIVQNGG